ncbi:hypothetical protein CBL_06097 [Carabus blaptoides fortunei]
MFICPTKPKSEAQTRRKSQRPSMRTSTTLDASDKNTLSRIENLKSVETSLLCEHERRNRVGLCGRHGLVDIRKCHKLALDPDRVNFRYSIREIHATQSRSDGDRNSLNITKQYIPELQQIIGDNSNKLFSPNLSLIDKSLSPTNPNETRKAVDRRKQLETNKASLTSMWTFSDDMFGTNY